MLRAVLVCSTKPKPSQGTIRTISIQHATVISTLAALQLVEVAHKNYIACLLCRISRQLLSTLSRTSTILWTTSRTTSTTTRPSAVSTNKWPISPRFKHSKTRSNGGYMGDRQQQHPHSTIYGLHRLHQPIWEPTTPLVPTWDPWWHYTRVTPLVTRGCKLMEYKHYMDIKLILYAYKMR